eukprot:9477822-Pyramimonas_sp.AAC.1
MSFVLSSARGDLRHGARANLTVWMFWTVGHVMHRVDWLLLSVWKNTTTIIVHLGKRLHQQIIEGGRRDVGICLSCTWGAPAGLGRPPACGRRTLLRRRRRVAVCIHAGLGIICVGRFFDRRGPCSSSLTDMLSLGT